MLLKDDQNQKQPEPTTGEFPAKRNVESIIELEQKTIHSRSPAQHVADKVIKFAGSPTSIFMHLAWFAGWISLNVGIIPEVDPFDKFPFSFLTLVVSLEAIFLTLLVLISQNRMIKEADKRAHLDLQVNLLAEQETTLILRMVQRIGKHLGLEEGFDEELEHLSRKTDVQRIAATLDEKLPS